MLEPSSGDFCNIPVPVCVQWQGKAETCVCLCLWRVISVMLPCRSLGDFVFKSPQPLISAQLWGRGCVCCSLCFLSARVCSREKLSHVHVCCAA